MPEPQILVSELTKTYHVPQRDPGLRAAFRSLIRRTYVDVHAVRDISFTVAPGEIVGFIGPNGAGKTTTLKMLAGLLHPSAGRATVAGFTPWERRPAYLRRISMVLGNKSQMMWDIPPLDTFRVIAEIYSVPPAEYRQTLDELISLLDMKELLTKPVRNFSLGERMKCELVAGLLYRPAVLFLDEPTLGLDVSMQARLRRFVAEYNRRSGATVILTSHYMADVEALCPRVIVIHQGKLLYDGGLSQMAARLAPFKLVRITLAQGQNGHDPAGDGASAGAQAEAQAGLEAGLPAGAEIIEAANGQVVLRVRRAEAPGLTAHLLQALPITDLTVEDPPLEAVIDQVYQEGAI